MQLRIMPNAMCISLIAAIVWRTRGLQNFHFPRNLRIADQPTKHWNGIIFSENSYRIRSRTF